jgi:hypothetical protein
MISSCQYVGRLGPLSPAVPLSFILASNTVRICRISMCRKIFVEPIPLFVKKIYRMESRKNCHLNRFSIYFNLRPDEEKGGKMTRQVQNRQGRIITPLHTILFVLALLVFIFTVVYRMAKSENFSTAMATLVESLLIVSFFVFLGLFLAYLFYLIHEKIRQGSGHRQLWDMFVDPTVRKTSTGKPDPDSPGLEQNDEVRPRPNS